MSLTPADVHNIAFKKSSIGKRGYDEEQVDGFLDELVQELIRLIEENNELRTAKEHGGERADAHPATTLDEMTTQLDRVQREKAVAVQSARAAQAELEQARTRSGPVTADDRKQAFQVLTMAERTADTHLTQAQRESHALLSDARSTAQQITGDALAEADALERDAQQRNREAMDGLDAKRATAQREIEDLEAFKREYRSRLNAHVESQLRDLDGRGTGLNGSEEVTP